MEERHSNLQPYQQWISHTNLLNLQFLERSEIIRPATESKKTHFPYKDFFEFTRQRSIVSDSKPISTFFHWELSRWSKERSRFLGWGSLSCITNPKPQAFLTVRRDPEPGMWDSETNSWQQLHSLGTLVTSWCYNYKQWVEHNSVQSQEVAWQSHGPDHPNR